MCPLLVVHGSLPVNVKSKVRLGLKSFGRGTRIVIANADDDTGFRSIVYTKDGTSDGAIWGMIESGGEAHSDTV